MTVSELANMLKVPVPWSLLSKVHRVPKSLSAQVPRVPQFL